jgi:hypothetical protein
MVIYNTKEVIQKAFNAVEELIRKDKRLIEDTANICMSFTEASDYFDRKNDLVEIRIYNKKGNDFTIKTKLKYLVGIFSLAGMILNGMLGSKKFIVKDKE